MTVTIRYGASLTVPHPIIPYANVKPTLEIEVQCELEHRDTGLANIKAWVHASLEQSVKELSALVAQAR